MAGIVTGNSLGLFNTSLNLLGQGSGAQLGRFGERVYVNSGTGNLVVQNQDVVLASVGADLALVRTYNSQGLLNDDNADNWRLSAHRRVFGLTGTVNTVGSTITKAFGDGTELVYTYDSTRAAYLSTGGDGAHDTLSYNSTTLQWTFTDGNTRATETYNSSGQLINTRDADGNALTYSYTGALLTQITDASGQITTFVYSGTNLTEVRTTSQGVTQTWTRYTYDASNRLTQVRIDLSPADNLITDGRVYTTSYTYDGTTKRVASITQGDGSKISFTYNTLGKIATYTEYTDSADTVGKTTTFAYTSTTRTDITDPLGRVTTYTTDTQGRLSQVLSPAVNGTPIPLATYTYDAQSNVTRVTDGNGNPIDFSYDASGNLTLKRDAGGNTTTFTYDAKNQVVTETAYLVPDPDGAGTGQPTQPLTTRYAYDGESHLRFVVSREGRVTEHRYDAAGNRVASIAYSKAVYNVGGLAPTTALTEAQLQTWAGTQDLTQIERTDYAYENLRGNIISATRYGQTTTAGVGVTATASITRFVYDQRGLLLQTIDPRGEATTTDANDFVTTYTYDGLGRLLTSTQWIEKNAAGVHITRPVTTVYDDVNRRVTVTLANGLATVSTYDRRGRLLTVSQTDTKGDTDAANDVALGITTYKYDAAGRLRMTLDQTGVPAHVIYDEAGRLVAAIDGTGAMTETVYDKAGNVIQEIRYANRLSSAQRTSLTDAAGNPTNVLLNSLRPPADSANDRVVRYVYDAANRLVYAITTNEANLAQGFATQTLYDGAGRVTDVIRYNNAVSVSGLPATPTPANIVTTAHADDRRTRTFYDADGKLLGTLDAEGFLCEYGYNAAGKLAQALHYALATTASLRTSGTFAALKASVATNPPNAGDQRSYVFYNGKGETIATLDAENYLTEYAYDVAGNRTQETRYYAKGNAYTGAQTIAQLRPAVLTARVTITDYNGANEVTQVTTNPSGTVTRYTYDKVGNVIQTDRAWNTSEVRTNQARYDVKGRVLQELTAEGSVALQNLFVANPNPTQTQIDGIWNDYSLTHTYDGADRRTSTTDQNRNKSVFYYDEASRLRFTVNMLGEVAELRYNAFGQVSDTYRYTNRIVTTGLTGGLVTPALISQLTPGSTTVDNHTSATYTVRGAVKNTVDALSFTTIHGYNAFGELATRLDPISTTASTLNQYTYDRRGLLKQVIEDADTTGYVGLKRTTTNTYDAFGRLVGIDGDVVPRTYKYDRLGRQIEVFVSGLNLNTSFTYDAFSRVLTQTDPRRSSPPTTYVYDDTNRSFTLTTSEGIKTITRANRHGETVQIEIQEANGTRLRLTDYTYDKNGNLTGEIQAAGTLNLSTTHTYDRANRRILTRDANGVYTRFDYDAANRLLTRIVDPKTINTTNDNPNGLDITTRYLYDGQGRTLSVTEGLGTSAERITNTIYDAKGQVKEIVDALGIRTTYTYDARGKTLTITEAAGRPEARTTTYVYDNLGRRTQQTKDPAGLNVICTYVYDKKDNLIRKTEEPGAANQRTTRYFYDAANRLRYTVDALGYVTEKIYDANGQVATTVVYANAISLVGLSDSTTLTDIYNRVVVKADSLVDQKTDFIYDRDGRLLTTTDAEGKSESYTYDAAGNKKTFTNKKGDVWRYDYDAAGRLIQEHTPVVSVTRLQEVNGVVQATTTQESLKTFIEYDAVGNVTARTEAYGTPEARKTSYQYDKAGRQIKTTFPTVGVYDPALDSVATNGIGWMQTANVKNYAWVRSGNALVQTTGVSLEVPGDLFPDKTPTLVRATIYRSDGSLFGTIDTDVGYYTVQTLYKHTDEDGTYYDTNAAGGTLAGTGRRWTAVNNWSGQVNLSLSTLPSDTYTVVVDVIDEAQKNAEPDRNYDGADNAWERHLTFTVTGTQAYVPVQRKDTNRTLSTATTYDALGNAVVNQDVSGNYGYKVYDRIGRVLFEIDALRNVTEYGYDGLGNRLTLKRYANALAFSNHPQPFTEAEVRSLLVASSQDRTITTQYDRLGRATDIVEPAAFQFDSSAAAPNQYFTASPTIKNVYNAFGQVIKESKLKNPLTNAWIDTHFYYDAKGNKTAQIDALGFVTKWEYDETGDVVRQIEFAQALTAGSWSTSGFSAPTASADDRECRYVYDRLNRKISETKVNIEYSTVAYNGVGIVTNARGDVTITYGYDAVGNATRVTDPFGVTTYTFYDALGRATATAAPDSTGGKIFSTLSVSGVSSGAPKLIWEKPTMPNTSATLKYRVVGAVSWAGNAAIVDNGRSYSVDLTTWVPDKYEYELSYTRAGEAAPYAIGTGIFDLVVGNDATSQHVVGFVERPSLDINFDSADIKDDIDGNPDWSGDSTISLIWHSLETWGAGDITVTVNYVTKTLSGTAGVSKSRTKTLSAAAGLTGTTFTWQDEGIHRVTRVRVEKVVDGVKVMVLDHTADTFLAERLILRGKTLGPNLTGINIAGVGTRLATALPYAGTTPAGVFAVDLGGLAPGVYTYTPVGTTSTASGTFEVRSVGTLTKPLVREAVDNVSISTTTAKHVLDENGDPEWTGTSSVSIRWNPLDMYGAEDVKVTVDYIADNGGGAVTNASRTQTVGAAAGLHGVDFTWTGQAIHNVSRVRVWKVITGGDRLIHDVSRNWDARRLEIALPVDAASVKFEYRKSGTTGPYREKTTALKLGAQWFVLGYDDLSSGLYDYILTVRDAAGNPVNLAAYGGSTSGTFTGSIDIKRGGNSNPNGTVPDFVAVTTLRHNSFGNVVAQTRHANSATLAGGGVVPGSADSADQTSYQFYDSHGHVLHAVDAENASSYFAYDAKGNVVKKWQRLTDADGNNANAVSVYGYDALGRQISTTDVLDPKTLATTEVDYNAFGETIARGLKGGARQEFYHYDADGRVWRTNDKDGVDKVYLYGLDGKAASEIKSQGRDLSDAAAYPTPQSVADLTTDIQRKNTVYDALGRVVQEETPTTDATRVAIVRQRFDRWGNVVEYTAPNAAVTRYRYDYANQVVQETKQEVDVWGTDGLPVRQSPILRYFYDKLGRPLAETDANGNTNSKLYDAAGHVIAEHRADSTAVRYGYDALGRRTAMIDPYYNETKYIYDRNNRLVEQRRPVGLERYAYDQAGNRIVVDNGLVTIVTKDGVDVPVPGKAFYFYDTRGNVVKTRQPLGQEAYSSYDLRGNKVKETFSTNLDVATWTYDYFGRLIDRKDIGDADYSYSYNYTGQLLTMGSVRPVPDKPSLIQSFTYSYYRNGQLQRIVDDRQKTETFYEYDDSGQRIHELFTKRNSNDVPVTYQDARTTYDALGRVVTIEDARVTDRKARITYHYDAQGNRRHLEAIYYEGATKRTKNHWYLYDSLNRLTLSQGVLASGQIQINDKAGREISYDLNGNRLTEIYYSDGALVNKRYAYDGNNRLAAVYNGSGKKTSAREYDEADRITKLTTYSTATVSRYKTYDANGRMLFENAYKNGTRISKVNYYYEGANNIRRYRLENWDGTHYVNNYYYTYIKYDTYKERNVNGYSTFFEDGKTTSSYDDNGNITAVTDREKSSRNRTFVVNNDGQIVKKTNTDSGNYRYYYYANTKPVGSAGTMGSGKFDYNYTPITQKTLGSTPGSYMVMSGDTLNSIATSVWGDGSLWYIIADANGISSDSELKVGTTLVIPNQITNVHNNADTFKPYNEKGIIGDTTPYLAPPPVEDGGCGIFGMIIIMIIAVVVAAITQQWYLVNFGTAIGTTMAGATIYSAGSLAVAGAVGAAAGSVASQLAGMALGIQDKFNWAAVATGALTAGLTAGLGSGGIAGALDIADKLGKVGTFVFNGVANNVISQGLNIITGQQKKFDWKSVAIAGVSAGVTGYLGTTEFGKALGIGADPQRAREFSLGEVIVQTGVGIMKGAVMQAFNNNGKVDWANVAADAFGNALSNSIVGAMRERETPADVMDREEGQRYAMNVTEYEGAARDRLDAEEGAEYAKNWAAATALSPGFARVLDRVSIFALPTVDGITEENPTASAPEESSGRLGISAQAVADRYARLYGVGGFDYEADTTGYSIQNAYLTRRHNRVTDRVLSRYLFPSDLLVISGAQSIVDLYPEIGFYQDAASAFVHAMQGTLPDPNDPRWSRVGFMSDPIGQRRSYFPDQLRLAGARTIEILQESTDLYQTKLIGDALTPEEATKVIKAWMQANFELTQVGLADRTPRGKFNALFHFGVALHTAQDWTSPSHQGPITGRDPALNRPGPMPYDIKGGESVLYPHADREAFDPGPGSNMYRVTSDLYHAFFVRRELPSSFLDNYGRDPNPDGGFLQKMFKKMI